MTAALNSGPAVAERCRQALLAPTDRAEIIDVLRVGEMRKHVLADRTPMTAGQPGDDIGSWAERSAVLMPFGRILYRVARALGGPIVEVGTGSGVSTAYLAAGSARTGGGPMVTLELDPTLAERAQYRLRESNFTEVTVRQGDQADHLPDILIQMRPALVHLDSDHRHDNTVALLDDVAAIGPGPTVVCLDDIRWSREMEEVWAGLLSGAHGTTHAFDLDLWGVVVLSASSPDKCLCEDLVPPRGLTSATIRGDPQMRGAVS